MITYLCRPLYLKYHVKKIEGKKQSSDQMKENVIEKYEFWNNIKMILNELQLRYYAVNSILRSTCPL